MFGKLINDFYKAKKTYVEHSKEHSLQMRKMSEDFTRKKNEIDTVQNEHRIKFDEIYNSYFNLRNK